MSDLYDQENYDRTLDFLFNEQEVESVETDNVNGFWLVDASDWMVTCTSGTYGLYAFAEGVGEHHTGKEIGMYETVEEVLNEIRERAGDDDA